MKRLLMVAAVLLAPAASWAQQAATPARDAADPRPHIQVLQQPADIASFYRSSGGSVVRYSPRAARVDPYAVAGFYRSSDDDCLGYGSRTRARRYERVVVVGSTRRIR